MKKLLTRGLFLILSLSWFATAAQAFTTTTNYAFQLPQVNNVVDQNLWGAELNTNFSNLDALLLTASNFVTRSTTTTDSITSADQNKLILANATSAAYAESLPAASSVSSGFLVIVKKTDSSANAVTVTPNLSDTIEGKSTFPISAQYGFVALISDNVSNWNIISQSTVSIVAVKSVHRQVFTSGGTYTPTAGILYADVEGVGGGGGGGGSGTAVNEIGAGGGSGGYFKGILSAATIGSSQTITIGAAGAAGSSGGGSGGSGGTTSIGSILSATGGSGGTGNTSLSYVAGGAGGTATGGDYQVQGEAGTSGGASNNVQSTGGGGSTPLGQGGKKQVGNSLSVAAQSGTGYGSGGGSGPAAGGAAAAGQPGIIIITEYCSQ